MAHYADSDAAMAPPKGARALAITGAGLTCALMAAAATITLLGNRHGASVRLDLEPVVETHGHAPAPPVLRAEAATPDVVMPAISQAQYAGRALIADPALTENSPLGPLPRIADDAHPRALPAAPRTKASRSRRSAQAGSDCSTKPLALEQPRQVPASRDVIRGAELGPPLGNAAISNHSAVDRVKGSMSDEGHRNDP